MRRLAATALTAAALAAGAAPAAAHIDILPTTVEAERSTEFTVRVPTEREIPTTSVRVDFPKQVTVYSFAPLDCGDRCTEQFASLREVVRRAPGEVDLGDAPLRIVTIALADNPTPAQLEAAAAAAGADGRTWRFAGADWDAIRTVVGAGFRRYVDQAPDGTVEFDPGVVVVDTRGVVRADNRYRTISDDTDKLVRQLGLLGDELRYAHGPAAAAYSAAHLFLCYG